MSEIFKGYWSDLKIEVWTTWERVTLMDLEVIDGDLNKLEELLIQKYGLGLWEVRRQLTELLQRYDNLAFLGEWDQMKEKIRLRWDSISELELHRIHCSRFRLLSLIESKFGLSKGQSQRDMQRFLNQFLD